MLNQYTKYVQELNLDSYNVFHECNPYKPEFFDIQGVLGKTFGYGKHAFTLAIMDPTSAMGGLRLKERSQILFEVVDNWGNIIQSGLTDINHINGSSFAYFNIQENLLDTSYEVTNGPAKLIVVGELEGKNLPSQYKNTYNIRTQIPFFIRKQAPNDSDILFVDKNPTVAIGEDFETYGNSKSDVLQNYTKYHTHEFDKLGTYTGKLKHIDIEYRLSSSLDIPDEQYHFLDKVELTSDQELLTRNIIKSEPAGTELGTEFGNALTRVTWTTSSRTNLGYSEISIATGIHNARGINWGAQAFNNLPSSKTVTLSGEHSIIKPVRKTVDDEQFYLKLNYSGSGAFFIVSAVSESMFTNADSWIMTSSLNNPNWQTEYFHCFEDFNPTGSTGPNIYGNIYPDDDGTYKQVSFTVPANRYFAVGLRSEEMKSASFNDVSIKQNPSLGNSPAYYYYKTPVPDIDYRDDVVEYRYKFINEVGETVKDYQMYPVIDTVISSSKRITPLPRILSRAFTDGQPYASRIRMVNTSSNDRAFGQLIEAVASGSSTAQQFSSPGYGIGALYLNTVVADDHNHGGMSQISLRALTSTTSTTAAGIANTGSAYSAYFGGSDGAGDVIVSQKLGIGSFNTSYEHPSESLHVLGNALIEGDITAQNYIVSSSVSYITTSFSSGSTVFGDDSGDKHEFTGSLLMDSSSIISSSGKLYIGDLYVNSMKRTNNLDSESVIYINDEPTIIKNSTNNVLSFGYVDKGYNIYNFTQGQNFNIFTDTNLFNPKFIVTGSTGYVGMGIPNPTQRLQVSGNLHVGTGSLDGHITASGNISSSGHIMSTAYKLRSPSGGDEISVLTTSGDNISIGDPGMDDPLYFNGDLSYMHITDGKLVFNTTIGNATSKIHFFGGDADMFVGSHITASGDISASSGDITADRLYLDRTIEAGGGVTAGGFTTTGNTTFGNAVTDTHTFTGHITASNNISASGTGSFGHLMVGGGNFSSASLAAGGGGGVSFPTTEVISSSAHIHTLSHITASGNISASATSTGSFGKGHFVNSVGIGTNNTYAELNIVGPGSSDAQVYINDADNGLGSSDGLLIQKSGVNTFIYNRDTGHLEIGTNNKQQLHIEDEAAEGQLKIADGGIDVTGHITASNNISASGTIDADIFTVNGFRAVDYNSTRGVTFGYGTQPVQIGRGLTQTTITLEGNVTASGNISASGDLTIEDIYLGDANSIRNKSENVRLRFGTPSDNSELKLVNGSFHASNITASGNISSSETVFGNVFKVQDNNALNMVGDRITFGQHIGDLQIGKNPTQTTLLVQANVTASGNISGSAASTGSFGHLIVDGGTPIRQINVGTGLDSANNTGPTTTINLDLTEVITSDGNNRFLTSDGDGTLTAETGLTMDSGILTFQGASISASHGMVVNEGNEDANFNVRGSSDDNLLQVNPQYGDKIGIGTANPTSKLSVEGGLHVGLSGVAHITASGNISSSGTITGLSGSFGRVNAEHLKSSDDIEVNADIHMQSAGQILLNSGNTTSDYRIYGLNGTGVIIESEDGVVIPSDSPLEVSSHITASGNISGSAASTLSIGGSSAFDGQLTVGGHLLANGYVTLGNNTADRIVVNGPLTASSDMSSSALIQGLNVKGINSVQVGSGPITLIPHANNTNNLTTHDSNNGLFIQSHITASGNISASGGGHVFGGTGAASLNVDGQITASGNISSSFTSTGSFGTLHLEGANFSSASLAAGGGGGGTTTNVLTAGTGVDYGNGSGGQTFDGSAAKTINLDLTEVIASDTNDRVLTTDGDGTLTAEAKLSFDGNDLTIAGDIADVQHITASGNISASGYIDSRLKWHTNITHHGFYHNYSSNKIFVPMIGSTSEFTSPTGYSFLIAPYAGRLVKVILYNQTTDPGETTVGFITGSYLSSNNLGTDELDSANPKQEIMVDMDDDTNTLFQFSSSVATFEAGDRLGLSVDRTSTNNNWFNLTAVWEYDTNNSGSF